MIGRRYLVVRNYSWIPLHWFQFHCVMCGHFPLRLGYVTRQTFLYIWYDCKSCISPHNSFGESITSCVLYLFISISLIFVVASSVYLGYVVTYFAVFELFLFQWRLFPEWSVLLKVFKMGDSNNIKMHDVFKIVLLDVVQNSICNDKKKKKKAIPVGFEQALSGLCKSDVCQLY